MNRSLSWATALAVASLLAAPASAQRAESGDYSIAVSLFETGSGTTFNLGRMFTDQLHVGIDMTWRKIEAEDRPSSPTVGVRAEAVTGEWLAGPTIRWFAPRRGPIVPFLRTKFGFGNAVSDLTLVGEQTRDQDTWTWQVSAAIGAEWFPAAGVGISAHTGLRWSKESMERYNANRDLLERTTSDFGAFTSGLAFSFYFH